MPRLSIIIPTFNSGGTLEECLRSIAAQSFRDYEVLIQDGGSTDDTLEKVARFKSPNGGVEIEVASENDKGPYDAMNRAVRRAKGEWLYFLGSDDRFHDDTVLGRILGHDDLADWNVMYGDVKIIGETHWAKDCTYGGVFTFERLLKQNICHQALFYRTKFAKDVGLFNTEYPVCADWDFNMRCWAKTKFKYIDVVVADFCAGGLSSSVADSLFKKEIGTNILRYFNVSLWHPALISEEFMGFEEVAKIRESKMSLTRVASRIRRIIRPRMYG